MSISIPPDVSTTYAHSCSSNRETLGTRLRSASGKIGEISLFDGKYTGQNSLFLAFFVGFYAVEPQNSTKRIHFSKFFGQKQGPGTSLKCKKIRDSTSVKILLSLLE